MIRQTKSHGKIKSNQIKSTPSINLKVIILKSTKKYINKLNKVNSCDLLLLFSHFFLNEEKRVGVVIIIIVTIIR